jgi:hypothetical protein
VLVDEQARVDVATSKRLMPRRSCRARQVSRRRDEKRCRSGDLIALNVLAPSERSQRF